MFIISLDYEMGQVQKLLTQYYYQTFLEVNINSATLA